LKDKEPYKEPQLHENPKKKKKQVMNYINKLKALGVDVTINISKEGRIFTEQ
jgi:hypothetical protein